MRSGPAECRPKRRSPRLSLCVYARGYVREPRVAVEVETYRPFFVLGEITTPRQFAVVPGMTLENAVAIAGGFTPRAYRHPPTLLFPSASS